MTFNKNKCLEIINSVNPIKEIGKIIEIIGLIIEADGPKSSIGDLCHIYNSHNSEPV